MVFSDVVSDVVSSVAFQIMTSVSRAESGSEKAIADRDQVAISCRKLAGRDGINIAKREPTVMRANSLRRRIGQIFLLN